MLLQFFVAKLQISARPKAASICLKYNASGDALDVTSNEKSLISFCFPLGPEAMNAKEYMASVEYTYTLTVSDGCRYHGFCRMFLPPAPTKGSKQRFPFVLCVISENPWAPFFFKSLQVLEVLLKSSDLLGSTTVQQLPGTSSAAMFLTELAAKLSTKPRPGDALQVSIPQLSGELHFSSRLLLSEILSEPNSCSGNLVTFHVPPDCGNGKWNAGISLARLLWQLNPRIMTTLLAALLLERRIIMFSSSQDTVSAAVQAAAALIYPFKWHHIFLPLLPKAFQDYLTAPMPFLVGMPAQMLGITRNIAIDDVVMIDLDMAKCDPPPGSARDDARNLPWRENLEAAFAAAKNGLKSPTEYESNPFIAGIMQEFFCKLLVNFPRYVHPEISSAMSSSFGTNASPHSPASHSDPKGSTALKGHGYSFEQDTFIASHRRNEKARTFLDMMRQSQMYEVFVQERLELTARAASGEAATSSLTDEWSTQLARYTERRKQRVPRSGSANACSTTSVSTSAWGSITKGHRRGESDAAALATASASLFESSSQPMTLEDALQRASLFFDNELDDFSDSEDDGNNLSTSNSHGSVQVASGPFGNAAVTLGNGTSQSFSNLLRLSIGRAERSGNTPGSSNAAPGSWENSEFQEQALSRRSAPHPTTADGEARPSEDFEVQTRSSHDIFQQSKPKSLFSEVLDRPMVASSSQGSLVGSSTPLPSLPSPASIANRLIGAWQVTKTAAKTYTQEVKGALKDLRRDISTQAPSNGGAAPFAVSRLQPVNSSNSILDGVSFSLRSNSVSSTPVSSSSATPYANSAQLLQPENARWDSKALSTSAIPTTDLFAELLAVHTESGTPVSISTNNAAESQAPLGHGREVMEFPTVPNSVSADSTPIGSRNEGLTPLSVPNNAPASEATLESGRGGVGPLTVPNNVPATPPLLGSGTEGSGPLTVPHSAPTIQAPLGSGIERPGPLTMPQSVPAPLAPFGSLKEGPGPLNASHCVPAPLAPFGSLKEGPGPLTMPHSAHTPLGPLVSGKEGVASFTVPPLRTSSGSGKSGTSKPSILHTSRSGQPVQGIVQKVGETFVLAPPQPASRRPSLSGEHVAFPSQSDPSPLPTASLLQANVHAPPTMSGSSVELLFDLMHSAESKPGLVSNPVPQLPTPTLPPFRPESLPVAFSQPSGLEEWDAFGLMLSAEPKAASVATVRNTPAGTSSSSFTLPSSSRPALVHQASDSSASTISFDSMFSPQSRPASAPKGLDFPTGAAPRSWLESKPVVTTTQSEPSVGKFSFDTRLPAEYKPASIQKEPAYLASGPPSSMTFPVPPQSSSIPKVSESPLQTFSNVPFPTMNGSAYDPASFDFFPVSSSAPVSKTNPPVSFDAFDPFAEFVSTVTPVMPSHNSAPRSMQISLLDL